MARQAMAEPNLNLYAADKSIKLVTRRITLSELADGKLVVAKLRLELSKQLNSEAQYENELSTKTNLPG